MKRALYAPLFVPVLGRSRTDWQSEQSLNIWYSSVISDSSLLVFWCLQRSVKCREGLSYELSSKTDEQKAVTASRNSLLFVAALRNSRSLQVAACSARFKCDKPWQAAWRHLRSLNWLPRLLCIISCFDLCKSLKPFEPCALVSPEILEQRLDKSWHVGTDGYTPFWTLFRGNPLWPLTWLRT